MELRIGSTGFRGPIERYAAKLDLLELRAEPTVLPRSSTLRAYRRAVPAGFVFSVLLPRVVGELEPGAAFEAALKRALEAAEILEARFIVLQTRPVATPSRRTERRIAELVARLPREGRQIAWEPRGLWDPEQQLGLAERLGLLLVRDLRRQAAPPGPAVYARLLGLGTGARLSVDAAEIVAARLAGKEQGYVVVEGSGAVRGAAVIRERLVDPEFLAEARSGRITGTWGGLGVGTIGEPELDDEDVDDEDVDDEDVDDEDVDDDVLDDDPKRR